MTSAVPDVLAVDVVNVFVHAVHPSVEETPGACLAVSYGTEVGRSICVGKGKFRVLSLEVTLLASEVHHVLGIHHVLLVLHVKAMNAALVGMTGDAVVGDADGHPYGALFLRPLTDHFKNPYLVGVSYGEALAFRGVAKLLHE